MSTPSDDPPNENHPPNPVSQVTQVNHDHQDAKIDTEKEISPTSVFVNSEPIREEQVQNAVRFLSHPKVRGSPVVYRRSFLEKKGLTNEEIDEAFRRVPDTAPTVTTTSVASQDGQVKSSLNIQQPQAQVLQSTLVGHVGSNTKVGILYRFRWYHGVYAISCLTASGFVAAILFKRFVVPKLKSWIRWIVLEEDNKGLMMKNDAKPSIVEEAAAAAKTAAMAAADVARASQEMMMTKSEEKRCLEELISTLHVQANEIKSLSSAIYKLEAGHNTWVSGLNINGKVAVEEQDNQRISGTSSAQPYTNGKADIDLRSVRSVSPPVTAEPSAAPHPKSYMEIIAMIQRGEKPPNIREINDAPPNPNQPLPTPQLAPKPKPWEVSQAQTTALSSFPLQPSNNGTMNELFNDKPNGDSNEVPWWQRKNPRITEIKTVDEMKLATNTLSSEQPVKRSWVPPQPPPVALPEAAAAIRHQKKASFQTEPLADGLPSGDVTDELQQLTKISEFGSGLVEANGEKFEAVPSNENLMQDNREALEA